MSLQRLEVGPRMSQAVVHGDTVYTAGIVAKDLVPSVARQTEQVLAEIDRLLALAGTDKSKVILATIWLADIRGFEEMNQIWDAWVVPGHTPVRATVEARLATPRHLVEIQVRAVR
jgi:enamine deaminase RidA (YjgF/YER057c/UK114 family)